MYKIAAKLKGYIIYDDKFTNVAKQCNFRNSVSSLK